MPTSKFKKDYFNFNAGLFSDGGYLNTPPNTATDLLNVTMERDGSIKRRLGLDYETNYVLTDITVDATTTKLNRFLWENPGNISGKKFLVISSGLYLYFFNYNASTTISDQFLGSVNLQNLLQSGQTEPLGAISFATGKGRLFVANENLQPAQIRYNPTVPSALFTIDPIYPRIRDLVGLADGIPPEATVTTFIQSHYYNLLNRGWPPELIQQTVDRKGWYPSKAMIHHLAKITYIDPTDGNPDDFNKFSPDKLSEVYNYFGNTSAPQGHNIIDPWVKDRAEASGGTYESYSVTENIAYWVYDPSISLSSPGNYPHTLNIAAGEVTGVGQSYGGGVYAQYKYNGVTYPALSFSALTPEQQSAVEQSSGTSGNYGTFIQVNETRIETQFVPGTISLNVETIPKRPKAVAFYNGRLCFAGTPHEREQGRVYISQIVDEQLTNINRFYQEADPSAEHINALVDSDGFVVDILAAANVIRLEQVGYQLLVFAENGIWAISGSDINAAAKPTDFSITKLTNIAPVSYEGIEIAGNSVFYVARDGIYTLAQDQVSGSFRAQSIIHQRLYTYWTNLSTGSRTNATLFFNESEQELIVLIGTQTTGNSAIESNYDTLIIFNNVTQSITIHRVASSSTLPFIFGAVPTSRVLQTNTSNNVVDENGNNVIDISGNQVVVGDTVKGYNTVANPVAYLTLVNVSGTYKFTVSLFKNTDLLDWYAHDSTGTTYSSYIETSYLLNQEEKDYILDKHIKFLYTYFKRTETSYTEADGFENKSSCLFRTKWDFADNTVSNKWTSPVELYRFDRPLMIEPGDFVTGYPITTYRHTINGNGRAVQLRFESNGTNNFHLLGWSIVWEITPLI